MYAGNCTHESRGNETTVALAGPSGICTNITTSDRWPVTNAELPGATLYAWPPAKSRLSEPISKKFSPAGVGAGVGLELAATTAPGLHSRWCSPTLKEALSGGC